ncbi:hypothetical protein [Nocardia lasii]|uniref:Transposase n=1 Tax=Nocardia lasii TaxID=1616107 RepID=A0ABW1K146_9NOCA
MTMQILLKIVPGNTDLLTELSPLLRAFAQLSKDDLTARLAYILSEGDTVRDDVQQLYDRIGPLGKEVYMTTAQTMRDEFRAEGRVEMLLEQLAEKFGPLPAEIITAVLTADTSQLQVWTRRVLTAGSLAEMRFDT